MKKSGTIALIILAAVSQLLMSSCSPPRNPVRVQDPEDSVALPFPTFTFTRTDSALSDGYFFIATFETQEDADKHACSLYILDTDGAIVWCKPNTSCSNFQMHDDATMSYFTNGKYYFLNREFKVADSLACVNGATTDAHELKLDPLSKHYYLIGIRTDTIDCTAMTPPVRSHWKGTKKTVVKYGVIQEFDENKQFIWEWNSKDWFRAEDMDPAYMMDSEKLDIPHFNAIDVDCFGNLLLTARYTNEVVYLNRTTGEIEWRLGGNRPDFTLANDSVPFLGQHQAHFLHNGNVLLYDNGYSYAGNMHNARSIEYKLDTTAHTATRVWSWEYPKDLVAESTGGTQRIDGGKTLVSFGKLVNRTPNVLFAVVNEKDSMEITCSFADTLGTYRTYYYPVLRVMTGQRSIKSFWEEDRCVVATVDGSVVLWSNGLVSNAIYADKPGVYQWFKKNSDGSYAGSYPVVLTEKMLEQNHW